MARAGQLPGSLAELVHLNALELSSARFDFHTGRLLEVLDETLARERARPEGNFEVPSIAGATGRRCDAEGRPVQEVVFTRGPLLYRVKLEHIQQPRSTDRIVELARVQARKAS